MKSLHFSKKKMKKALSSYKVEIVRFLKPNGVFFL